MANVRSLLTKRWPIGKRNGNWFIRIPLWLQGTILIFSAGFLSLLILTIVAGFKTWQYSESLMRERLSNFAAMTALQVEESFGGIQNRLAAASSSQALLSVLSAINRRDATPNIWHSLEDQFEIQFNGFPSLYGFVLYDKNLRIVYTHQRRVATGPNIPGQQVTLLPQKLLPLSDSTQKNDMVNSINRYAGGIISNTILPQWELSAKDPVNITFSVSRGVSKDYEGIYSTSRRSSKSNATDWAGYCTFLLSTPYSIMGNVKSSDLFDHYQALTVQRNKVGPKNFTFLVPFSDNAVFLDERLTWPIYDFPSVTDAAKLVDSYNQQQNFTLSNSSQTANSTYTSAAGGNGESDGDDDDDDDDDDDNGDITSSGLFDNPSKVGRRLKSASRYDKGNIPRPELDLHLQDSSSTGYPAGKQGRAVMRTETPWKSKSSVGYSWANVMNQKWLIFVQIPQSEAFNPAVHLRNVVIGVGVGILGAIVLIMAPLSRWQTRGLYIIYQNMRLRPMFVSYEEGDNEEVDNEEVNNEEGANEEGDNEEGDKVKDIIDKGKEFEYEKKPSPASDLAIAENAKQLSEHDKSESSKGTGSTHSFDTSGESFKDTEAHSISASPEAARTGAHGRVPTSLPTLKRIYTDELDDLVFEYNNMVHKLNNQYLHLEDEVRMRTREAQKARELTEKANSAKSEFIAIISHELRTPLNGIMGLTSVSVEDNDVVNIKNSLGLIIVSGRVLMELLNELLELSKSLIGVEPSARLFTPFSLLETLPNMFQSRASDLSVTFSLAAVPSDISNVTLRGDIDHVIQICLNFMSNAMKFSERNGSVSVILHLRPFKDPNINTNSYEGALDGANAILEILVTDSGVGMSSSQLAKIFDLFVQGDDPLRKNHRGAGLGMALSKQLAEGIGGYVAVFSAESVGSSVVLRVPVECVGRSAAEVESLNGPPIEFKVKDVYTTLSFDVGNVMLVKPTSWSRGQSLDGRASSTSPTHSTQNAVPALLPPSPSMRRSRHSHQSSSGSKMLLTRAHPVTKLLKSQYHQSSHQHQQSHSTAFASLNSNGSGSASTSEGHPDHISPMEIITGRHKNDSSSSLLLVVPPTIEEQNSLRKSRSSWYTAQTSPTPPMSTRESSPTRQRPSISLSAEPSATSTHTHTSPMMQEGLLKPSSSPTTLSSPGPPAVFVTSAEGQSVVTEIDAKAKLLVAEDNPLNNQIMVKMLKHLGLENISTAFNGEEAVKMVEKSIIGGYHFAIIFMDISMPVMNGIDATQFIRTTLGYPYPIVALTGFSDPQSRSAIMAASVQEVLSKPVMRNDIARVLQKYIGKSTT